VCVLHFVKYNLDYKINSHPFKGMQQGYRGQGGGTKGPPQGEQFRGDKNEGARQQDCQVSERLERCSQNGELCFTVTIVIFLSACKNKQNKFKKNLCFHFTNLGLDCFYYCLF